jgi:hypothetical protein
MAAVPNEEGSRFVYTVPSPEALAAWLRETVILEEAEDSSAEDLYSTLTPSSTFKLYVLPHSRELLFRAPHWRIDGIGMLHLQNAFFRLLADGASRQGLSSDDSAASPLSPPLDEVACVPQEGTPAMRQAADEEINVCLSGLPALSLATKPVPLPAHTRRHGINLAPALSQRIFAACKERGVTVTATVHAALILAMAPHAQHNFDPATRGVGGGKYTAWIPLDLRKYLPAPWHQAAVSVYQTGLPCSINLSDTNGFDAIAAALASVYRRPLDKDEPRNLFHFLSEYVRKTLGLLSAAPADPLKAPAHPELSSLGRINDYVQTAYVGAACTVEIEDWWMAIEQVTRSFQAYLWTWDGQLHLGANYNDAFYEAGFIEAFVDNWKAMLVQALGVE